MYGPEVVYISWYGAKYYHWNATSDHYGASVVPVIYLFWAVLKIIVDFLYMYEFCLQYQFY